MKLVTGLPDELGVFLKYAKQLKFDEKPDYSFCHYLIDSAAYNIGLKLDDGIFDWSLRACIL